MTDPGSSPPAVTRYALLHSLAEALHRVKPDVTVEGVDNPPTGRGNKYFERNMVRHMGVEDGKLHSSFCRISITLTPKLDKDSTKVNYWSV